MSNDIQRLKTLSGIKQEQQVQECFQSLSLERLNESLADIDEYDVQYNTGKAQVLTEAILGMVSQLPDNPQYLEDDRVKASISTALDLGLISESEAEMNVVEEEDEVEEDFDIEESLAQMKENMMRINEFDDEDEEDDDALNRYGGEDLGIVDVGDDEGDMFQTDEPDEGEFSDGSPDISGMIEEILQVTDKYDPETLYSLPPERLQNIYNRFVLGESIHEELSRMQELAGMNLSEESEVDEEKDVDECGGMIESELEEAEEEDVDECGGMIESELEESDLDEDETELDEHFLDKLLAMGSGLGDRELATKLAMLDAGRRIVSPDTNVKDKMGAAIEMVPMIGSGDDYDDSSKEITIITKDDNDIVEPTISGPELLKVREALELLKIQKMSGIDISKSKILSEGPLTGFLTGKAVQAVASKAGIPAIAAKVATPVIGMVTKRNKDKQDDNDLEEQRLDDDEWGSTFGSDDEYRHDNRDPEDYYHGLDDEDDYEDALDYADSMDDIEDPLASDDGMGSSSASDVSSVYISNSSDLQDVMDELDAMGIEYKSTPSGFGDGDEGYRLIIKAPEEVADEITKHLEGGSLGEESELDEGDKDKDKDMSPGLIRQLPEIYGMWEMGKRAKEGVKNAMARPFANMRTKGDEANESIEFIDEDLTRLRELAGVNEKISESDQGVIRELENINSLEQLSENSLQRVQEITGAKSVEQINEAVPLILGAGARALAGPGAKAIVGALGRVLARAGKAIKKGAGKAGKDLAGDAIEDAIEGFGKGSLGGLGGMAATAGLGALAGGIIGKGLGKKKKPKPKNKGGVGDADDSEVKESSIQRLQELAGIDDAEDEFNSDPDAMVDVGDDEFYGDDQEVQGLDDLPEPVAGPTDEPAADDEGINSPLGLDEMIQAILQVTDKFPADRLYSLPEKRVENIYNKFVGVGESLGNGYGSSREVDANVYFPSGNANNAVTGGVGPGAAKAGDNPLSTAMALEDVSLTSDERLIYNHLASNLRALKEGQWGAEWDEGDKQEFKRNELQSELGYETRGRNRIGGDPSGFGKWVPVEGAYKIPFDKKDEAKEFAKANGATLRWDSKNKTWQIYVKKGQGGDLSKIMNAFDQYRVQQTPFLESEDPTFKKK